MTGIGPNGRTSDFKAAPVPPFSVVSTQSLKMTLWMNPLCLRAVKLGTR
jgi:hypothetical protein